MLETARGGPLQFREEDILRLHALFYGGIDPEHAGRYREGQVFITGTEYVPPTAEEVPGLMAGLVEELNKRRDAMHRSCWPPTPTGGWWIFTPSRTATGAPPGS